MVVSMPKSPRAGGARYTSGLWETLFRVHFNGKKLLEVEDETFQDAGGVGDWTKADRVTLFDDFTFAAK